MSQLPLSHRIGATRHSTLSEPVTVIDEVDLQSRQCCNTCDQPTSFAACPYAYACACTYYATGRHNQYRTVLQRSCIFHYLIEL